MAPALSTTSLARSSAGAAVRVLHLDPDAATGLEQQAPHQGARTDAEVGPGPCRRQVADGAGDAQAAELVHRVRPRTPAVRCVGVGAVGIAERAGGVQERLLLRHQLCGRVAADADGSGVAVVGRLREVQVPFQAPVRGQHPVPGPLGIAGSGPFCVIFGRAAQSDGGVDGARTAHHPPARKGDVTAPGRLIAQVPVVIDVGVVVTVDQIERRRARVCVVGPGLDQQHRAIRVFARPGGDGAAGAARADYDQVHGIRRARLVHAAFLPVAARYGSAPPARRPLRRRRASGYVT